MTAAFITGTGVFLPNDPVGNEHIEEVLGKVNDRSSQVKRWVLDYNGIETRYYALDPQTGKQTHTNAEMTVEATKAACADAKLESSDIQVLACGSSSPDQFLPNHGVTVHGLLKNAPCEVVATTGVCCSGMTAFKYGYMSVLSGLSQNAVVTGSELASVALRGSHFHSELELKQSKDLEKEPMIAFENEFLRWMLSDGAGAWVISDRPREDGLSLRIDWVDITSFANEAETCMYYGCVKREDGSLESFRSVDDPERLFRDGFLSLTQDVDVLRSKLPETCRRALIAARDKHELRPDDIDWILPHYSSEGFRDPFYDGLSEDGFELPWDRWFTNLKSKGNTGSASIYIILEEAISSGRIKRGDRIMCMVPESSRFTFCVFHLTAI